MAYFFEQQKGVLYAGFYGIPQTGGCLCAFLCIWLSCLRVCLFTRHCNLVALSFSSRGFFGACVVRLSGLSEYEGHALLHITVFTLAVQVKKCGQQWAWGQMLRFMLAVSDEHHCILARRRNERVQTQWHDLLTDNVTPMLGTALFLVKTKIFHAHTETMKEEETCSGECTASIEN